MNWLTRLKEKTAQKRKLKEMAQTASVFATLEKLEKSGMVHWEEKSRRMFIEQPLALLMMRKAEQWQNFVQNLYLYTYYQQCQRAWNDYMIREELAAVRKAAKGGELNRHDVERIRRARREEIAQSDMEAPKVEGFEFFIVRQSTEAKGELVAVGHYDPEKNAMEMAPWEEVAPYLTNPQ